MLELVKQDPGITARVLRVANSALYGVRGGVATLRHAVQLLGLESVRGIAAAACFNRNSARSRAEASIDGEELHVHCIATALAAEALAKATGGGFAAQAFIAGLLHDFGVLARLAMIAEPTRHATAQNESREADAALLDDIAGAHEHYGAVVLESVGTARIPAHRDAPSSRPACRPGGARAVDRTRARRRLLEPLARLRLCDRARSVRAAAGSRRTARPRRKRLRRDRRGAAERVAVYVAALVD